jgi:two-component system, cell cycle sensor histidine kinase and response regulator CckA
MDTLDELVENGIITGKALGQLEALEEEINILRAVKRNSDKAIIVTDSTPEQIIQDVNIEFLNLYGYTSKEDVIGKPVSILRPKNVNGSKAQFEEAYQETLKGNNWEGRVMNVTANGTELPVLLSTSRTKTKNGDKPSQLVSSIYNLKEIEQNASLAAIGKLAAGFGHDLNNAHSAAMCYSTLLQNDLRDNVDLRSDLRDNEDVCDYLNRSIKAITRATKLVEDFMQIARGGNGYSPEIVDPNEIIPEIIDATIDSLIITEKAKKLRYTTDLGEIPKIEVDPKILSRGIENLVSNAAEASSYSGLVEVRTSYEVIDQLTKPLVGSLERGEYVKIEITDTGRGIASEKIPEIFKPFYTERADRTKGTGLGLLIVQNLIEKSGGALNVVSELNQGTTFELYFPAHNE